MVFPLVPLALAGLLAGTGISTVSSLYQQNNYRSLTSAQNSDYRRWISDYEKNTGRHIRYPNLPNNAGGQLLANGYGISNSYAQTFGTIGSAAKSYGAISLGAYRYNNTGGHGVKRWLY